MTAKQAAMSDFYHFWITHNHNFRPNMKPQKVTSSIGPPALPSFICWEKKAFLYPINTAEPFCRTQSRKCKMNVLISRGPPRNDDL